MKQKKEMNVKQSTGKRKGPVAIKFDSVNLDLFKQSLIKKLIVSNIVMIVITLISILTALAVSSSGKSENKYFVVDQNMRIVPIIPKNKPYINDAQLINWVNTNVSEINTITFSNWRQELQKTTKVFTKTAYVRFIQALKASGNLNLIINKRLNTIVSLTGATVIVAKGLSPSLKSYVWKVQVPYMINYEGSEGVIQTQRLLAEITVIRVPTTDSISGIKIQSYITKLAGK